MSLRSPRPTLFPYTTLFRSYCYHPRLSVVGQCRMCMVEVQGMPKDRKSTRLNSSHVKISYAVFCLKKKNKSLWHLSGVVHTFSIDSAFICTLLEALF